MRKITASLLVLLLAMLGEAAAKAAPAHTPIAACQAEAQSGHVTAWRLEPSLRPAIDAHRARMSEACAQLTAENASKTDALDACLAEAARGPRHIQRGRNMDRDHVARQRELCRKLAAR